MSGYIDYDTGTMTRKVRTGLINPELAAFDEAGPVPGSGGTGSAAGQTPMTSAKAMNDSNGDGIPDGAQMTVRKMMTDPDGNTTEATATFVKGRKPGLTAAEIFGINTTGPTGQNNEMGRIHQQRIAGNKIYSGADRRSAMTSLQAMERGENQAANLASGERVAGFQTQTAQAKVDALLAGKEMDAQGRTYAADQGRAARENAATTAANAATAVATTKAQSETARVAAMKENQDRLAKVREASLALRQGQQYKGPEFSMNEMHQDPTTGVVSLITGIDERGAPKYTVLAPTTMTGPVKGGTLAPVVPAQPAPAPMTTTGPAATPEQLPQGTAPGSTPPPNAVAAAGKVQTSANGKRYVRDAQGNVTWL